MPGVDGVAPAGRAAAVGGRDRGHLELVAGAEQPVAVQRRAPAVADHAARLAQAQPRRGQVVGGVVEHLAAADPLELRPHPRDVVDQPRADLDHGVELAGDDPRHRERLRAELEGPAADRGGVDQLAQHLDRLPHRPAPEAVAPEHPADVGVGAERDRARWTRTPGPAAGQEPVAGLDLDHAPELDVGHRRLAVAERRQRDRDAGRLEPGHRRPGPVDRVDDQDVGGLGRARPARGPRSRRPCRGARSATNSRQRGLGERVDRERDVSAGAVAAERPAPRASRAPGARVRVASGQVRIHEPPLIFSRNALKDLCPPRRGRGGG